MGANVLGKGPCDTKVLGAHIYCLYFADRYMETQEGQEAHSSCSRTGRQGIMDVGLWLAFFPAFKAIISILQIKWLKFIKSIYFANPLSDNLTFSTVCW